MPNHTTYASYLPIAIPIFFVVILTFIVIRKIKNKKQAKIAAQEARTWAAARGWKYQALDKQLVDRWDIPAFQTGGRRKATDIMTGLYTSRRGIQRHVMSFQYQYTVSTEDNSHTYHLHAVAVLLPNPVPGLGIVPEGPSTRVLKTFGSQDIQFESQEFNRRWRITGDNLPFAHAVVNPQAMEFLLTNGPSAGCYFLRGNALIFYGYGLQAVARVDQRLGYASDFLDLVPDFVWQDTSHPASYQRPTQN